MKINAGVKSTSVSNVNLNRRSNPTTNYTQTDYEELDYTQTTPPEEINDGKKVLPNVLKSNSPATTTTTVKPNNIDSTTTTTTVAPNTTASAPTTVTVSVDSDNYSSTTHTEIAWFLENLTEYYNDIDSEESATPFTLEEAEYALASVLDNLTEEQKEYYSAYKENDLFNNGYIYYLGNNEPPTDSILGVVGSEKVDGIEDYGAAVAEKYQEIMPIIRLEEDIESLKYEQKMNDYIELIDSEEFKQFYNQDATNQALELFIYQNCFNLDDLLNSPDYMNGVIFMSKDNTQYQYDDFASLREKLSQLNQTNLEVYYYLLKNKGLESANEYLDSINPNVNYEKQQSINYVAKYSKEFEEFIDSFRSIGLDINKENIDYFNAMFQEIDTVSMFAETVNLQYDFLNQIYTCKVDITKKTAKLNGDNTDDGAIEAKIKELNPKFYQNYTEAKELKLTLDYVIDNCKSSVLKQRPYEFLEQTEAYKSFYDNIRKNPESELAKLYADFNLTCNYDGPNGGGAAVFLSEVEQLDGLPRIANSNSNDDLEDVLGKNARYFMSDERKKFFYLLVNQGQDSAYNYFLTIHNDINSREGFKDAEEWMKKYNNKEELAKEYFVSGSGLADGFRNYVESLGMLFSKNEVPTILEYKEMYIFNELLKDEKYRASLYEGYQQLGEVGSQIAIDSIFLLLLKLPTVPNVKAVAKALAGIASGGANAGEAKHTLEMAGVSDEEVGIYTVATLASSQLFTYISSGVFKYLITPNASAGLRSLLNNKFIFDHLTAMAASYADSNFKTIFKSCVMNHKIDINTVVSSFDEHGKAAFVDGLIYATLDYATNSRHIRTKFPVDINGVHYEIDAAKLIKKFSQTSNFGKPSSFGNIEANYTYFKALYEACPKLIKDNPNHIFDDYLAKMESVSDGEEFYEEVEDEVQDAIEEDKVKDSH